MDIVKSTPKELSFEDALAQLKAIVEKLESGSLKLDESITMFEQGMWLREVCQKRLDNAKLQISKILVSEGKAGGIE